MGINILRPYGRAADPVAILDTITELKSMAPGQDVRSEEKRSEEKKRKEKTRYWLHAHGAGNEREKEEYSHKGSTPTPKRRSFQVSFSTCLGYFWLHSRTKR